MGSNRIRQDDPVVIVGYARTPIGCFQGALKPFTAPDLGAVAIQAAVERAMIAGDAIDEVIMGCVLTAGLGQAPARQAALAAGIPDGVGCSTVNKMCGSGMKAIMLAHDMLQAGSVDTVVAGGMESMSNAPYLVSQARQGLRLGHGKLLDHMFVDGLEDAYEQGCLMGVFAETCAKHYGFTREAQDRFALESLLRAKTATQDGSFRAEIISVNGGSGNLESVVQHDEQPERADLATIPAMRPAFREGGTVTAANASSISDGASALVLMRQSQASRRGLTPLARILGHASHAQKPAWFTTAPIHAINKLTDRIGVSVTDVDLFEVNEAFAVVTMAAMQSLALPHEKINIHGGACALGHPIGASGARIVVTLLAALNQYGLKRGIAAVCIGGGEATALAIERMP